MSDDENLSELSEAARRAGYIVNEQIEAIIERAEQHAAAIRRDAERDAEDTRRAAVEAAQRLLARLEALEFPLGSLVASLRDEAEHVTRQIEDGGRTVDALGTALPSVSEEHTVAEDVYERHDADAHDVAEVRHEEDLHREEHVARSGQPDEEEPVARREDGYDDSAVPLPTPAEASADEAADAAPPEPRTGDWKRWIIEDDEEQEVRPGSARARPAGAKGAGAQPEQGDKKSFSRRRAKPRS